MDKEKERIREAIDGLEPRAGAKERMLRNIREKAAAQQTVPVRETGKKLSNTGKVLRWALPAAACLALVLFGTKLLRERPRRVGEAPVQTTESAAVTEDLGLPVDEGLKTEGTMTQIANPFLPVEHVEALEKALGLRLRLPDGAEEPECFLVNGEMAEVNFRYQGSEYTLRAARSEEDISGLYGDVLRTETIDPETGAAFTAIGCGDEVYNRITWTEDGANFVLMNTDGAPAETLRALYEEIHN